MGGTVTPGTKNAKIQVSDASTSGLGTTEKFTEVKLIDKNFVPIRSWSPMSPDFRVEFSLTCIAGDYFYVRVKEEDGGEAISSPIWVQ